MRELLRSWLVQSVVIAATFSLVGFLMALAVFSNTSQILSGSILTALAAGTGGEFGWLLLCGMQLRPAWWRTISAGIFAGVVFHPIYLVMAFIHTWEWIAFTDLITGTMFSLLIGGIITVPSGVAAAIVCRITGAWRSQLLVEQSHAMEQTAQTGFK